MRILLATIVLAPLANLHGAVDDSLKALAAVGRTYLSAGAGFIVMVCGDVMTMPGLPAVPAAASIDVDENGRIVGLF